MLLYNSAVLPSPDNSTLLSLSTIQVSEYCRSSTDCCNFSSIFVEFTKQICQLYALSDAVFPGIPPEVQEVLHHQKCFLKQFIRFHLYSMCSVNLQFSHNRNCLYNCSCSSSKDPLQLNLLLLQNRLLKYNYFLHPILPRFPMISQQ